MRVTIGLVGIVFLAGAVLTPQAHAQRGMGEQSGVARQIVKPEVVSLSGTVLEVKTGPCKLTTGRSYLGTHFMLETPEGESLNIHLGPATAVEFVTKELPVGATVTVKAFRTPKMPDKHYTAQTVVSGSSTIQLSDGNLRPVWTGERYVAPSPSGPQWPRGFGRGQGRGYGRGWGYGRGYGGGWGRGAARGAGFNRGWTFIDENGDHICDNYERFWGKM